MDRTDGEIHIRHVCVAVALAIILLLAFGGCSLWNMRPTADFEASDSPAPGIPVNFTNTSTDPNGFDDLKQFAWDLGDGTLADTFNVSHTYTEIGTFAVQLTVYDAAGEADTCEKTIEVRNHVFGLPEEVAVGSHITKTSTGQEIAQRDRYTYSEAEQAWIVAYYGEASYLYGQLVGYSLHADDILFWARVPFVDDLSQAILLTLTWEIRSSIGEVVGSYRDPQEYALSQTSLVGGIDAIMSYWGHIAGRGTILPEGRYTTRLWLTDKITGEKFIWDFPFIVEYQAMGY